MFKPAYKLQTVLTGNVTALQAVMTVEQSYYNMLAALLGVGVDYTTAIIGEGLSAEPVEIRVLAGNQLSITRGIDGVVPETHLAGDVVRFSFTQSSITSFVPTAQEVDIVAGAGMTVTESMPGVFVISADQIAFSSPTGTIDVSGSVPQVNLDVNLSALGLCGTNSTGGEG